MNEKFTEKIGQWLTTPAGRRDCSAGALMLLQLSGNRIQYARVMANAPANEDYIEHELQKYYNFRVADLTHKQVEKMVAEADAIVAKEIPLMAETADKQLGRRADHDRLPEDIKAIYAEIPGVRARMRDLHVKLRSLSLDNATCPDSERYPFAQEIIKLGRKMRGMWAKYDSAPAC